MLGRSTAEDISSIADPERVDVIGDVDIWRHVDYRGDTYFTYSKQEVDVSEEMLGLCKRVFGSPFTVPVHDNEQIVDLFRRSFGEYGYTGELAWPGAEFTKTGTLRPLSETTFGKIAASTWPRLRTSLEVALDDFGGFLAKRELYSFDHPEAIRAPEKLMTKHDSTGWRMASGVLYREKVLLRVGEF